MWEKIEAVLNQKNLTQYQLAKKMGVSVSTITELKMGRINKPSFELMCKIADALEVSLDELRERK
ncbi:helix-turn-helix domain-containing protein [Vagococcus fluvialis]|uniref:helix-turn-helix domain-containing protein n=1 Tax=Vagococcus fluvialis TaxID=2738 RepID=UPI003D102173